MAGNASEEEAAWRDLVAQYGSPPAPDGAPVPWPAREDLPAPYGGRPSLAAPGAAPGTAPSGAPGAPSGTAPGAPAGAAPGGTASAASGAPASAPSGGASSAPSGAAAGAGDEPDDGQQPDVRPTAADPLPGIIPAPPQVRIVRPAAPLPQPPRASQGQEDQEDQFVPPVPPPLPRLDPVSKGAWAALFGGPGYLMIAVMTGWPVPGWAAFLSVAAFVGGFTTLVIRMGERPPHDSGPDDGAVV